jgi:hypothetical protein
MEEIVYLLGVHEYTVEMIGTNNIISNNQIQVWYKKADGTEINPKPYVVNDGEDFKVGTGSSHTPTSNKWIIVSSGVIVNHGDIIKIHSFGESPISNLIFRAI